MMYLTVLLRLRREISLSFHFLKLDVIPKLGKFVYRTTHYNMVPAILMIKLWEACSDSKISKRTTKYIQNTLASFEGVEEKCQTKAAFLSAGLELLTVA